MKHCQVPVVLSLLCAFAALAPSNAQGPKAGEMKLEPYVFEAGNKEKVGDAGVYAGRAALNYQNCPAGAQVHAGERAKRIKEATGEQA
ncbi:MAG TPA: hypothetical protein VJ810_06040 [Blastocatellia bacterium]|nr:hypothetical protein [Blastocatellia bacterium]